MTVSAACAVAIGPGGGALRRQLGPTAWVVLETTVARAHRRDSVLVADTSARSLAAELGLAKNTVARALLVSREAGVLMFTQTRASDGSFAAGRYLVELSPNVLTVAVQTSDAPIRPRSAHRLTPASVEQLALLPE